MNRLVYSSPLNKLRIPPLPPTWREKGTDPIENPVATNHEYENAMESYLKGVHFSRFIAKGSTKPTKIVYDIDPDFSHVYPEPSIESERPRIKIVFKPHKSSQTAPHKDNLKKATSFSQSFNFRPNPSSPKVCQCDCHKRAQGTLIDERIQTMTTRKTISEEMKQQRTRDIGQVVNEIAIQSHEYDDLRDDTKKNQAFRPKLLIITRDTKTWDSSTNKREVTVMDELYRDLMYEKRILSHSKFIRQVYDGEFLLDGSSATLPEPKLLIKPVGFPVEYILPMLPFQDENGVWKHPDTLATNPRAFTKVSQEVVKINLEGNMRKLVEKQRKQKEKVRLQKEKERSDKILRTCQETRVEPPKLNLLDALDTALDKHSKSTYNRVHSKKFKQPKAVPYKTKPSSTSTICSSSASDDNIMTYPAPFDYVPFRLPFIPPPGSSVTPMQPQIAGYDPSNPGLNASTQQPPLSFNQDPETVSHVSSSIHTPVYSVLTAYRYSPK